jgi:hypothetical protein
MIGLPNPYVALAGVLALAAAAGGGFIHGMHFARGKADHANIVALNKALADKRDAENRIAGLETAAAIRESSRQTEVREVYREIPKIVRTNSVVYDRTCIDAAGVHALDRARTAANGGDPGAAPGEAGPGAGDRTQP